MKGYLGISLTFLLGCQILETSSRVVQSFDGQIRLDQEREQRLVSENDVIDFTDVGKYCKFLLIKDEKGERNILYACPKRPGFKYNPPEEEEVSSLLLQHGSRSKDKATAEKFKCPFPWGTFPHPKDCSKYYLCLFMKPREMTCKISEFYDVEKEKCHKKDTVDCGERSVDGKEKDDDDEKDDDKDEIFKCPYPWGTYPHRKDCSKYYLCLSRNPYTMTCPKEKLYDIYSRECQREDEVDCGSRYNPREKSTTSQELEASTTLEYGTTAENPLVSSTIVEATSKTILITRDSTEGQKSLEPNTQTNRVSTDDSTAMEVTPSQVSSMNTDYYTESENLGSREHTGGTGSDGIRTTDVETESETISKYSTRSDVYTSSPQSEEDTPSTYDPSRDTQMTTRDDSLRTEKLASDTPDLLTSSTSSDIGVSTKTTEQEEEERKTAEVTSEHFSIKTTFDGSSSSIPEERTTEKVTEFVTGETFTPRPERVILSTTFKTTDTTEKESSDLSESTSNVFTHSKDTSENEVRDSTTLDTRGSFSWTTAGEDEEEATTNNPWTDRPDPGSFICPRKSGNFPDDSDCSTYFECRGGKSSVEKCPRGTLFHISFSICYAEDKVDCGSRKRPVIESTPGKFSTPPETAEDLRTAELTTPGGMVFSCPKKNGNFAHQEQCSLYYYSCRRGVAELRQCLPGLLYSAEHNLCLSESEVNCAPAKVTNG